MTRPEIDAVPSSTFPCSNKRAHNRGPGTRDRDNSPQSPSMSCATTSAGPRPHLLPPSYAHEVDKTTRHRGCSPGWLAHVLKRRASCTDASNVCMCVCVRVIVQERRSVYPVWHTSSPAVNPRCVLGILTRWWYVLQNWRSGSFSTLLAQTIDAAPRSVWHGVGCEGTLWQRMCALQEF